MEERARRLEAVVAEALTAFRVVVVTGPRQAGKSTLVRRVLGPGGVLSRLDVQETLDAALADPVAFASFGPTPRAIDEIQRAGDPLIRAIKGVVDLDRSPGQFLLNGSANFLTVPTISESLAGRAALFELWPFSQGELHGGQDGFLARAFADPASLLDGPAATSSPADYLDRICAGGFPEAVGLSGGMRQRWYRNYVATVTGRDVVELTGARRADQLPRLFALLAARSAGELVVSQVHQESGLDARATTEDYIAYLRMTYLVQLLPAWSRNLTRKITRRPKVHIVDSGLAAHALGKDAAALSRPTDPARGPLHETFAVNELIRQAGWLDQDVRLHHLRDRGGAEIDVVAEAADGRVVALEIKAAATANQADGRWLSWLRDRIGEDFVAGFVVHTGQRPFRLGDRLAAVPLSYLWLAD